MIRGGSNLGQNGRSHLGHHSQLSFFFFKVRLAQTTPDSLQKKKTLFFLIIISLTMYGHLFGLTAGLVFVLFFSPTPCVAKHDIHYGDVHTAMLQQSMKVLFGADEGRLARDRNNRLLPDPDEPARPPRYMMELYERYRDGLLQKENFGNTVRSIHASIGEVNGNAMFFFNLSAVKSSEKVLRAEVHLYKRKQSWMPSGSKLEILLHEIGPNYISETGRVTLHRASRGWQWRDVTEAVLSCLATSRKPPHLFAINFKTQRAKNGKTRPVALKKFATHHSRPFLIIYSNETETVKLDQLDKLAERLKLFLPGRRPGQGPVDPLGTNLTAISASGSETVSGGTRTWPHVDRHMGTFVEDGKNGSKKEIHKQSRSDHSLTDVTDGQRFKINIEEAVSMEEGKPNEEGVTLMSVNENLGKDQKFDHEDSDSGVTSSWTDSISDSISNRELPINKSHVISRAHSRFHSSRHHSSGKERKTAAKVILVGTSSALSDETHAISTNSTVFDRVKRSILTNEIPQDPVDYKTVTKYNVLHTNPGVLQTRQQRTKIKKDSRLIPYPKDSQHKKKRRKRKRPRRKNLRRRRLRFPKDWESESESSSNQDADDHLCKRRKLHVNFDDIGWGEWIISPRWFNAHYCSGSCPFPLTKKLHPSNHATIQSIVHAIGIYPGVPAPSCVPDSVSSITLLYFDEDRNVVLKNYPGMTVLTCACR